MSDRTRMTWIAFLLALLLATGVFAVVSCGDDDDDDDDGQATEDDDDAVDDDATGDDDEANEEIWTDPDSGLMWQKNPPDKPSYAYYDAIDFCQNLVWGDHDDWRLPTISELRTLIRGCEGAETGGACGVTDSCLDSSCWSDSCFCGGLEPPGDCFWPAELSGFCSWYWSSSGVADDYNSNLDLFYEAWIVDFGDVGLFVTTEDTELDYGKARCVR